MEEGEGKSFVKDNELASENADATEINNSKRINKRKQRFPTKQSTETPRSLQDIIQHSKEKVKNLHQNEDAEKFKQNEDNKDKEKTCVLKVTKKEKDIGEIKNASRKEKNSSDNDEAVTPRRSSRAPKKKKMYGFDDSEEENDAPSVKRSKKSSSNKSRIAVKSTNRQDGGEKVTTLNPVGIKIIVNKEQEFHEERETFESEGDLTDETAETKNLVKEDESNKPCKIADIDKEWMKGKQSVKDKLNTQKPLCVQKQMSPHVSNIPKAEDKQLVSIEVKESNGKIVKEEKKSPLLSMKEELRVINEGRKEAIETDEEKNKENVKGKDHNLEKTDGSEHHVTDMEVSDVDESGDAAEDSDSDYEIDEDDGNGDDDQDENLEQERKERYAVINGPEYNSSTGNKTDTEIENKNVAENLSPIHSETLTCSVCKNTFTCRKNLKRHMLTVHSANQGFQCSECETVLKSKKAYERHKTLHSENDYNCGECGKSFVSLGKVQRHVHETHKGVMPFPCGYENCEKRFSNSSNRRKHIAAVHLNIRKHNCHFCPKIFKNSSALRVHMYSAHEDQFQDRPKFICEVCHKVFGDRMKLKIHETVHSSIRPYTCKFEECGRTFRLKSNKIKHERVHENIRPYQCDKCDQAFSRKVYLETHQYKHTGIKKFQCPTCNKTFSQKGNLDIHIKIHSEDRQFYECERCSKPFSNKSNLTKHMQTVCREGGRVNSKKFLEQYVIQPADDRTTSDISSILQQVNEIATGDTVFIIQDENTGKMIKKMDKACGTDEIHARNNIATKEIAYKQNISAVNALQPTQMPQLEKMILTDLKTRVSNEVTETTHGPEAQTIYLENADGVEGKIPTQDEIIHQVAGTETVTYTELGNMSDTSNALAEIINPASSENVEYEIVSSGLDGVEEGILKEFLSKWNQQSTPPGTTVILDVQNRDNSIGADGTGLPDSVQYIVTVKDQE